MAGNLVKRFFLSYGQDRTGSMAVQFAVVAPVVALMLAAIIDLAMLLFLGSHVDGATQAAARQIRTGAIQQQETPEQAFADLLCNRLAGMLPCGDMHYDVRIFNGFATINDNRVALDAAGQMADPVFNPGDSEEIVAVTVLHYWHFMTPMLGKLMSNRDDNSFPIMSVAVFQNEPFESFD